MHLRLALIVTGLAATGLALASPSLAEDQYCEPRPFVSYCDGPLRENGSWRRCFYNSPIVNSNGGLFSPGGGNCYEVAGVGLDPYPWAPREHLQP